MKSCPLRKCTQCHRPPDVEQGGARLCVRHYRFSQVRRTAAVHKKEVPSREWLEANWPEDMICRRCSRKMNWRRGEGFATVATLQHNRDGTMEIICQSCNSRHASMPGDSSFDVPLGMKWCPGCRASRVFSDFHRSSSAQWSGRGLLCRACNSAQQKASRDSRRADNPEGYLEQKRAYYAANRAVALAARRKYYEANREKILARQKKKLHEAKAAKPIHIK